MKKFGASTAGIATLGTGMVAADTENDGRLYIKLWPQKDSDKDEVENEIHDVLVNFLNQVAIETWSVVWSDQTLKSKFGITFGDSNCDYRGWWSDFKTEVADEKGDVQVAVTDQTNFAAADGEAWNGGDPGFAFVGTKGGYDYTTEDTKRFKNLAIQEVGHTIINEQHIKSTENADPEHALGKVLSTGESTPMVTYYEESPATNPCCDSCEEASSDGNCSSSNSWNETHTHSVTSCTKDAVKKTLNKNGY